MSVSTRPRIETEPASASQADPYEALSALSPLDRRDEEHERYTTRVVDEAIERILNETSPTQRPIVAARLSQRADGLRRTAVADALTPLAQEDEHTFKRYTRRASYFLHAPKVRGGFRIARIHRLEGADTEDGEILRRRRIYISTGRFAVIGVALEWGKPNDVRPSLSKRMAEKERRIQEKISNGAEATAARDARRDIRAYRRYFRLLGKDDGLLLQLEAATKLAERLATSKIPVVRRNAHLQPGAAAARAAEAEVARIQALLDAKMSREQQASLLVKQKAALASAESNVANRQRRQEARMKRANKRCARASGRVASRLEAQAIRVEQARIARDEAYRNGQTRRYNEVNAALIKERIEQERLEQRLKEIKGKRDDAVAYAEAYKIARQEELDKARLSGIDNVAWYRSVRISYAISKLVVGQHLVYIEERRAGYALNVKRYHERYARIERMIEDQRHAVLLAQEARDDAYRSGREADYNRVNADLIAARTELARRQTALLGLAALKTKEDIAVGASVVRAQPGLRAARNNSAQKRRQFVVAQQQHPTRRAAQMIAA